MVALVDYFLRANIANRHEKQKFLKVIYQNFYKTYNPKAADKSAQC